MKVLQIDFSQKFKYYTDFTRILHKTERSVHTNSSIFLKEKKRPVIPGIPDTFENFFDLLRGFFQFILQNSPKTNSKIILRVFGI